MAQMAAEREQEKGMSLSDNAFEEV
jgi:hypothetical protein